MKNRSLNFKVISIVFCLMLGICTIGYIGLSRMSLINDALADVVQVKVKRVLTAKNLEAAYLALVITQRDMIIEQDPKLMKELSDKMSVKREEMLTLVDAISQISTPQGKQDMEKFKELFGSWWKVCLDVQTLTLKGDDQGASALNKATAAPIRAEAMGVLKGLVDRNLAHMEKADKETDELYASAKNLTLTVTLAALLLGSAISFFVLRGVSRTINCVVSSLRSGSEQVSQTAAQIATASEQLSEASTEQASSLEETVATIEELNSMVGGNAENAKQASSLSEQTSKVAFNGEQQIRQLVTSMQEISSQSKKIAEITGVIDDIAFQTNLLALNAAVEAARAGEQGKGFSVVADAVRSLAQRSAVAAKDINELIRESVAKIEKGSEQAESGGKVLVDILESVKKVTHINTEIASASSEQANGITQISKAMNQLDQVTQVNAAASEEAAASAAELSSQADLLGKVVSDLVIAIHGGSFREDSGHKGTGEPAFQGTQKRNNKVKVEERSESYSKAA